MSICSHDNIVETGFIFELKLKIYTCTECNQVYFKDGENFKPIKELSFDVMPIGEEK